MKRIFRHLLGAAAVTLLLAGQNLLADTPNASLQSLVTELNALDAEISSLQLSADNVCAPMAQVTRAARDAADAVKAVDESLAAPLQVDAATYDALDALVLTSLHIANEALRLSLNLQQLQGAASSLTIKDGMTAMLQLSDDIGTMADRIGEMADRILVMSDNIGLMADRILATQEIQSQNMTMTVQTLLQTQTNVLTLVSYVETQSYAVQLDTLYADGMALSARIMAVAFNPFTMKYQMQLAAGDVRSYLAEVDAVFAVIRTDAAAGTFYVDAATLTKIYNLSTMLTFVATASEGLAVAIDGLDAITSTPSLNSSLDSMLQLSGDIGTMADRIGEMGDVILAMADNIGMVADGMVATQQLQSANLAAVQQSILNAQEIVIAITVARGL